MINKLVKPLLLTIGIISLVLGFIGIFLPLLPTTPFVLLSAYCFAKSSERFHKYLMNHKLFGKIVSDFYEKKVITKKIKIISISMMWTMLILSIIFFMPFLWVKLVVIGIGTLTTMYIIKFPSK